MGYNLGYNLLAFVFKYRLRLLLRQKTPVQILKMFKTPPIRNKKCCICGKPVFSNKSIYCQQCSAFEHRMRLRQYTAEAVKAIWDYVRKYGYVCYYTGRALNMTDPTSPWYCVFDHCTPHDPSKIVITCALVNEMKTDLNEKDFWYMIRHCLLYTSPSPRD